MLVVTRNHKRLNSIGIHYFYVDKESMGHKKMIPILSCYSQVKHNFVDK